MAGAETPAGRQVRPLVVQCDGDLLGTFGCGVVIEAERNRLGVVPVVALLESQGALGGAGEIAGGDIAAQIHRPCDHGHLGERLVGGNLKFHGAVVLVHKSRIIGARKADAQIVISEGYVVRVRDILPAGRQIARKGQGYRPVAVGVLVVDAPQRQCRAAGPRRNRQARRRAVIRAELRGAARADLQRYRQRRRQVHIDRHHRPAAVLHQLAVRV